MTGDVYIHNGKIAQIAKNITPTDTDKIVDATGLTLLPGVIDPQVNFREPGLEHKTNINLDNSEKLALEISHSTHILYKWNNFR